MGRYNMTNPVRFVMLHKPRKTDDRKIVQQTTKQLRSWAAVRTMRVYDALQEIQQPLWAISRLSRP